MVYRHQESSFICTIHRIQNIRTSPLLWLLQLLNHWATPESPLPSKSSLIRGCYETQYWQVYNVGIAFV